MPGAFVSIEILTSETYTGHPLDTIKVRIQTSPPGTYSGVMDCIAKSHKQGGLRGFFDGATPALATAVIENTLVFGANETIKRIIMNKQADKTKPLPPSTVAAIGASAGFFQALFACPAEVVKCRLQAPGGQGVLSPFACTQKILSESGVRGLYRGFTPFVIREIPFYLVFFSVYEGVCSKLEGGSRSRDQLSAMEVLLAGGLAGCAGWTVVVPADTIKSKLQASHENLSALATTKHILKTEGLFRGLFKGWSAIMIRYGIYFILQFDLSALQFSLISAFPANAATFLGFELARTYLPSSI